MNYTFTINDFEGPLDLLLSLVRQSKMDIYEIPIKTLIDEYISFIKSQEELNIDIASEYLVMASELLHLKSKMLINQAIEEEETEEELSISSEEELRNKLIEYDKIKNITNSFKELEEKRQEIYEKSPENYSNTKITTKEYSIEDRIKSIRNILNKQKQINFLDLFDIMSKDYIIVTFLSVLDMSKQKEINIIQEDNFKPIIIEKR